MSTASISLNDAQTFLDSCTVSPEVFELRPDYRALLMVIDGLGGIAGSTDSPVASDLISQAEGHAVELLASTAVAELPHIAAWREAYRAFGAKPQRTRNSLEALTRRAEKGLPRVNTLTDIYNAVSILHQVPVGGEDFSLYAGPAALIRATGEEDFVTTAEGETVTDHPAPGEVVWTDPEGVTCRLWNWRQGPRTALSENTNTAFFIFDALDPMDDAALEAAGQAVVNALAQAGAEVQVARRIISAG